jgi:hypothetical protein
MSNKGSKQMEWRSLMPSNLKVILQPLRTGPPSKLANCCLPSTVFAISIRKKEEESLGSSTLWENHVRVRKDFLPSAY